jgi:hypothetical protein
MAILTRLTNNGRGSGGGVTYSRRLRWCNRRSLGQPLQLIPPGPQWYWQRSRIEQSWQVAFLWVLCRGNRFRKEEEIVLEKRKSFLERALSDTYYSVLLVPVYFQLWTAILLWTDCSIQQIRPVSDLQLYFGLHLRHRSDSIAPERTKDSNLTSTGKRTVSIFGVGVLRCAIPRCSKQVGFVDSRCCDVGCWSARPVPTHSTMMFLTQPPTISLTEETSCQCSPLVSVQWNAHSSGTL